MMLEVLIKRLQQIKKENGGNVKVYVRDYNGHFQALKKVEFLNGNKCVWIDASR